MKKYSRTLLLATALGLISVSMAQAGPSPDSNNKLTIINKHPDQRIQVFIRGEQGDPDQYYVEVIEAGEKKELIVQPENVQNKNTFEVTASTGNGGSPDWKLMGGRCSNLVTGDPYTLTIESTLGKLSCEKVPPSK